eukprot:1183147-Prorocentrum_minimum.AAC.2
MGFWKRPPSRPDVFLALGGVWLVGGIRQGQLAQAVALGAACHGVYLSALFDLPQSVGGVYREQARTRLPASLPGVCKEATPAHIYPPNLRNGPYCNTNPPSRPTAPQERTRY